MSATTTYDLFISYADADRAWVEGYLLDALVQTGVRCLSETVFELGKPRLLEFERAVQQSRWILLVLSPAYLSESWNNYMRFLAQAYGAETASWPVIPLILHPVDLPLGLEMLVALDATDTQHRKECIERLCRTLRAPTPPSPIRIACPYPGMKPFGEADSERFFGRDREIQELVVQVRQHHFLAVIGPSGSGKSSLVLAGLIPALRQSSQFGASDWSVIVLRPGETPMTALAAALGNNLADLSCAVTQVLETAGAAACDPQRLLLVVDQFEELFTTARSDQARFQELCLQLSQLPNCYVVLTVRSDFYSDLFESSLWGEIQAHRFEVARLKDDGLRDAIRRPAEAVGVFVEEALVERLVADAHIKNEPGVLPLVQEALLSLWDKRERRFLPVQAYEQLGDGERTGLDVAMARHADNVLAQLKSPAEKEMARRILINLIQPVDRADVRLQQPVAELRASVRNPDVFDTTLRILTGNEGRLLTISGAAGTGDRLLDISHEKLIECWPTLHTWLNELRDALQTKHRLEDKALEWQRLGSGTGGLLDEVELVEAEGWLESQGADALGYSEALAALVQTSRAELEERTKEKERQTRRSTRTRWGVAALILAVSLATLLWVVNQLENAPIYTGWQKIDSLDKAIGQANASRQLIIAASSTDPDLLYVSDATPGSLFKSVNGGLSWSKVGFEQLAGLPVNSIAASQQVVYVVTSDDIFVSQDAGTHWTASNFHTAQRTGQRPTAIAINPRNPSHSYVGTQQGGLYVTVDRGMSWSPVAATDIGGAQIRALTTDGQNIIVATDRGVWISRDATQTWRLFSGSPRIPLPVLGLAMPSLSGRFFMALGMEGIGDADLSSDEWFPLADSPPTGYISSMSAVGETIYAGGDAGLRCNRFWTWKERNWWRSRLNLPVPCARN